ncbi:MAG TPA: apolipoprotein N-acyltransferase, partial [Deltaproteobacteria bacterium]|nr:apolipoprotein N-acyltransferase [Deltaproteobacteria bacterium]
MGWLLAALSGSLAGFTYPTVFSGIKIPDLGWMAFFAWVPLFLALRRATPFQAFAKGFFASFFHCGISMYWIYTAMHSFGGLSPGLAVTALVVLFVVLSAYFGMLFGLSQWICKKLGWSPCWVRPWVWVGIEFLRGHLPAGGFPWSQIAYSQGGFLTFIQVSDLFGVYAVTWLLVFSNEVLALLWLRRKEARASAWKPAAFAAGLLLANLAYGVFRLHQAAPESSTLKVGIVQGNIPQDEKWLRSAMRKIIEIYRRGTAGLEAQGATLVIWPEAAWPVELQYDAEEVPYDLGLNQADLLFGAVTASKHRDPLGPDIVFNTALLADAEGRLLDHYHKRHLVPFGEYVPWKKYLFFARKMTAEVGDLQPGLEYRPISYRGAPLGVLICYEDIFPEISRLMTARGARALVDITNDAWYG